MSGRLTDKVHVPPVLQLAAVALFLQLCPASAQVTENDSLTLDRVIADVVQNNNRVAAARFMQESEERRASSTGVWDDPMLMLGLQNVPTDFDLDKDEMTMRMIGLSQSIPYSGYKGLERQASRADALAASARLRTTQIDLATAARQAYYDFYFLQLNLSELERQREFLQQIVASTTAKLRTNQAGQEEVLTSQADLWRLESSLLSLRQQVDAARFSLNSLRGLDPDAPTPPLVAPNLAPPPDSPQPWIDATEKNYPELQRLAHQSESYRFSAAAARRMQWPMLDLSASYGIRTGYSTSLDDHTEVTGPREDMVNFQANISLPIFGRGKQRQMARSMVAMQKSTQADAAQLRRDIRANILSLHSRAVRLNQSLILYRERILPATQDAYRSALAGYTANRTPFVTLLNAAVAVYRDRTTINDLQNEFARTLAEVERYTTDASAWATDSDSTSRE